MLKQTNKLTASEVKSRLKKGGKLEELKKQLLELNRLKKDVKKQTPKLEHFSKLEIEVEQVSPVASPVKLKNRLEIEFCQHGLSCWAAFRYFYLSQNVLKPATQNFAQNPFIHLICNYIYIFIIFFFFKLCKKKRN